MKITLFTSNNNRHNYLINLLTKICDQLWVVQEYKNSLTQKNSDKFRDAKIMRNYFNFVDAAQEKIFKKNFIKYNSKKIKVLSIPYSELNNLSLSYLNDFLKSDIYIVFGSSYIKGNLINFLIANKAINIHAGVSPYYRGADCNFWALYDDNPHLVGSTIHLLGKGLDSGPMLYHAMSNIKTTPFEYTMSSVKAAFHSISSKIKNKSIFDIVPTNQDINKEIRYSKKEHFNKEILNEYFKKKINLNSREFDISLLKDPFFLEK